MVGIRLFINGTEVDVTEDVAFSLNLSIADIREPQNRQNSFTKTVNLPATKTNNKLFTHIFEVNASGGFNPKTKKDAILIVDSFEQIQGYFQLKSITNENGDITYQGVIVGQLSTLYGELGTDELTALDFSDLNHPYSRSDIEDSWTATQGEGYYYPMIDYGQISNRLTWDVDDFFPGIYLKEYIDRIFDYAGKTYTSTFFNSTKFKSLLIPFNKNRLELSADQIEDRTFRASRESTNQTVDSSVTSIVYSVADLIFNDDSTAPNFDGSGTSFNTSTGEFTVPANGYYNISAVGYYTVTHTVTSPTAGHTYLPERRVRVQQRLMHDAGSGYVTLHVGQFVDITETTPFASTSTTTASPTYPDNDYVFGNNPRPVNPPNAIKVEVLNVYFSAGDKLKIQGLCSIDSNSVTYEDQTVPGSVAGTYSVDMLTGSFFRAQVANVGLIPGDTVNMNQVVPERVKMSDLLTTVIRMFNLYVEVDKANTNNYLIEPRDNFYNTTDVQDWTHKLDNDQPIEIVPVGALDSGEFYYTYKPDTDFLNETYTYEWNETYGEYLKRADTDFYKERKTTEILFSPTCLSDQDTGEMPIPTLYKADTNGQVVQYPGNLRVLIAGGLKDAPSIWTLDGTAYSQYPYSGHLDDPYTPTWDINFGVVREVFYRNTYNDIVWTDANLYNEYHRKMIEEIIDPDSKILTGYFNLNPSDAQNIDFRGLYFFLNSYWRLHRVYDYNPLVPSLTKCEFLKLKEGVAFTSLESTVDGSYTDNDTYITPKLPNSRPNRDDSNYSPYSVQRSVEVSGDGNYVDRSARNVDVTGDNNSVGADCERVSIQGSGNVIYGGVTDVVLINTNNKEVTTSGAVYVNGKLQGGAGSVETITSATKTLTEFKTAYHFDCTSNNITLTLPTVSNPSLIGNWTFIKKIDSSANTVTIDTAGSATIDGSASVLLTSQWDGVTIYLGDDFNWYIGFNT